MAVLNICLKRSFIGVASVIAVINVLMLIFILIGHGVLSNTKEYASQISEVHYMYIITIIPLVLVIFGLVGVCKKKKWAVIVFTAGMILMSLILLLVSIVAISSESEIADELRSDYQNIGPLPETSKEFQAELFEQQAKLKCCGLAGGYTDWGNDVPLSCECTSGHSETHPCVELQTHEEKSFMVYEKPCLPYLVEDDMQYNDAIFGTMIALSVLWMLSGVLAIVILCKMYEKDHSPVVVYHS